MKKRVETNPRRAGFTLIEMLVVLAILVLLMSLVGPRILKSRDKADISTAKSQIGMLQGSLESYALDMRGFPSTEDGLAALVAPPSEQGEGDKEDSGWDGPYITKAQLPKDPWGRDYQYEYPPTRGQDETAPILWSLGPDGEDNTDDDIISWVADEEGGDKPAPKAALAN